MLSKTYQSSFFSKHSLNVNFYQSFRRYCDDKVDTEERKQNEIELPDPPTTCCMSACPNCVWVEYANQLNEIFRDGGGKSKKIIEEKITDPNMKVEAELMSYLESKGLTDEINLIYVEEVRGSNASFIISSLLCNALKKNASVLFVTFHNSFQHYQHVCSKLGYNINNASHKSKIEVINPLEIPLHEENNLDFILDFNEKTEIFFQTHEGEQYLIIDDLSYLLLLTSSQDCIRFVRHYLYQRSLYPNLKVIICNHISPEDKESFIITNFMRSICRFIIKLTPLNSGLSSEVTGHMEITHRRKCDSDSTECNYLLTRKEIVLNPTVI